MDSFWKNKKKNSKITIFYCFAPKCNFFGFSWFFQKMSINMTSGFLRYNQSIKSQDASLELSNRTI